jgi:transposase
LVDVLERGRNSVRSTHGPDVQICTCYEAGYDGFWLHRLLITKGIHNQILDSTSIQVSRRRRNAKTDRIDAEGLVPY